ncbi:LPD29 domain-containing protein [Clostridioides difficile]
MDYFENIESLEDLKNTYKKLAKKYHPDMGGDDEVMKQINDEYDGLFPEWKKKSKIKTTETANSTRNEFYTEYGWKGANYNTYLSTKDIAKIIRQYVKEVYPTYKFSITTSSCRTIKISLMEAPCKIFNEGLETDYIEINRHSISCDNRLNSVGKSVLNDIYSLLKSYNYDDIDPMIDYFDTNFYMYFSIGKWDKPFKVVEKESIKHKRII